MYLSPWKIYQIARIIIGRKRMRKLIACAVVIGAIGAFGMINSPAGISSTDMSGAYAQQKDELSKNLLESTKEKIHTNLQNILDSAK